MQKEKLGFLGSGFPLFYNYLKFCVIMLFSLFLIHGIPNIVYNYQGNYCVSTYEEYHHAVEEDKKHPSSDFISPCVYNTIVIFSMANLLN